MSDQILALDRVGTLESGSFTFTERVGFLKKYGTHSQSFSTLQPGMQYFDVPGMGYIAYMRKWGATFVLSDPVCAPEDFGSLLESFHQKFPNASYIQVSKPVVDFLHLRFGLYGTQFGSESRIDLSKWSLSGKKKQILRTALNQAEKNGITVKERFSDDHTREISEAWIRTRKCKSNEIRFLIRPMEMDYRENERHFYAYQDGKAAGFIYFDPIYRNNEIISYVPNISRANADFRQGIFYTQNFFQNKLDKTILFIEPYFLKKPVRIGMIGINTNIEQVQGHKGPNPPHDLTISKEDNHKAQLTIVT